MRIDVGDAVAVLEEALAQLRVLDGREVDDAPTRAARRQKTEISRKLLYLAHLTDLGRVQIMDAYYVYKRDADPIEEPRGSADE